MAQLEVFAHGSAAQVEVAVFHTEVVATIGVVLDCERRHFALVEQRHAVNDYLNFAGGHVRVLARPFRHLSRHLDYEFPAEVVGSLAQLGVNLVVEHQLGDAVSVAKVDKSHATHFSGALHPSCQSHSLAGVCQAEFSTSFCSVHIVILYV